MSNNNNSSDVVVIGNNSFQMSANDRWLTTLAARVGVAVENALFYVKGGGGWVGANEFTLTNVTTGTSISGSNSSTKSGWLVGAGFEYGFTPNWTAKVEYDFLALTNSSFTVPAGVAFPNGDIISAPSGFQGPALGQSKRDADRADRHGPGSRPITDRTAVLAECLLLPL
jgi:outer membrane immunogenic protein